MDLTKKKKEEASTLALLARALGLCWGLHLLASVHVHLHWLSMHFGRRELWVIMVVTQMVNYPLPWLQNRATLYVCIKGIHLVICSAWHEALSQAKPSLRRRLIGAHGLACHFVGPRLSAIVGASGITTFGIIELGNAKINLWLQCNHPIW